MEDLNQLTQTLESMMDAHRRLLDLANEKRALLVDGTIQGLQGLLYRESSCAEEIQRLEVQRKQHVQHYMEQNGYTGHSFTIEEVLKVSGDPAAKNRLNGIAKQLRLLVQEIIHVNETNQQLLQTSLSYIQYTMNLHVPKEQTIGYGPKKKNQFANLLDAKI